MYTFYLYMYMHCILTIIKICRVCLHTHVHVHSACIACYHITHICVLPLCCMLLCYIRCWEVNSFYFIYLCHPPSHLGSRSECDRRHGQRTQSLGVVASTLLGKCCMKHDGDLLRSTVTSCAKYEVVARQCT